MVLVCTLAACGGGSDAASPGAADNNVVWGSSSQGSDTYVTAVSMSDVVAKNSEVATTVQAVGGAVAIVKALETGDVGMGIVNSAAASSAFKGDAPFEEPVDVRMHLRGYEVPWQLIVRKDAGIDDPSDLAGKRLAGERPALVELRAVTDAMLEASGVNPDEVKMVSTNETNEVIDALQQGTLDAAVLPGSIGASNLSQLAFTGDVAWIDLSAQAESMVGALGSAFSSSTIPAGTYDGQVDDVTTVAHTQVTVARDDLSEETVYNMTKALIENASDIQGSSPEMWSVENTLSVPPAVPFHAGAIKYFDEIGAWTEELQEAQDELMAK
jgi:uncharacterized protein